MGHSGVLMVQQRRSTMLKTAMSLKAQVRDVAVSHFPIRIRFTVRVRVRVTVRDKAVSHFPPPPPPPPPVRWAPPRLLLRSLTVLGLGFRVGRAPEQVMVGRKI